MKNSHHPPFRSSRRVSRNVRVNPSIVTRAWGMSFRTAPEATSFVIEMDGTSSCVRAGIMGFRQTLVVSPASRVRYHNTMHGLPHHLRLR
jgi:hypothetical protein